MKWKWLILVAIFLELATIAAQFVLPALQGRIFGDPKFPHFIIFHDRMPSDIVDFRGNVYCSILQSTATWAIVVLAVALLVRVARGLVSRMKAG